MNVPLSVQRDLARWYPLIEHPVQSRLISDPARFKVVAAGRRSGKTERAKRRAVKIAMRNPGETLFIAAPTRDQVKRIYWTDIKKLSLASTHRQKPSETELRVHFPNGSTIELVGLDKPARIEGSLWTGGIVDEISDTKPNAWNENIRPALDTYNPERPDYKAWCWLIGVPDGLNHYHDLYDYAATSGDPEWAAYTWKSADILPAETIASAMRSMSARQFRQEYEASFETASGRIYDDYGSENHTQSRIEPHEQIRWMHDQNYTPLSSAVGVVRGSALYLLDEIILTSAVSRQSAEEFVEKFKSHENKHVLIYGDPAGRAGEKHGQESAYSAIEEVLRNHGWKFTRKVKPAHPSIKDRQNQVRAKICNAKGERTLFVNPASAPYCHRGLATVQLKKGSTFLEEESDVQHVTTAIGYMVDVEWPINPMAMSLKMGVAN